MMLINCFTDSLICSKNILQQQISCSEDELIKRLIELEQQGIKFSFTDDKVRLHPLLPLLNIEHLKQALNLQHIHYKKVINSTNQYLLDHLEKLSKGDICVTEFQHAGRGRRGKNWISPFGGQIILSLYWTLPDNTPLNGLSLVIGLAIADVLSDLGLENIGLKWPNDILVNNRKLAGILVEIASSKNNQLQLVIGLGLNVTSPSEKFDVGQPYTELKEYLPNVDRTELIVLFVKKLYLYLLLFEKKGMSLFYSQWNRYDAFYDQEVCLIEQNKVIYGIEKGIDSSGLLQIKIEGNKYLQKFNIGDISLRKKSEEK